MTADKECGSTCNMSYKVHTCKRTASVRAVSEPSEIRVEYLLFTESSIPETVARTVHCKTSKQLVLEDKQFNVRRNLIGF